MENYDDENYSDENTTFDIVQKDIAIKLICPFISGNGQTISCAADKCMAWCWVNDDAGNCLMFN